MRRKSRDREGAPTEDDNEASDPTTQINRQDQDSPAKRASLDSPMGPDVDSQVIEGNPRSSCTASLVADYSDSASDTEAVL